MLICHESFLCNRPCYVSSLVKESKPRVPSLYFLSLYIYIYSVRLFVPHTVNQTLTFPSRCQYLIKILAEIACLVDILRRNVHWQTTNNYSKVSPPQCHPEAIKKDAFRSTKQSWDIVNVWRYFWKKRIVMFIMFGRKCRIVYPGYVPALTRQVLWVLLDFLALFDTF